MNNIITIDGTAASGKGTLARALAQTLGYAYMDTGALYRMVALHVIQSGRTPDEATAAGFAATLRLTFRSDDAANPALRTESVSAMTSQVSAYPAVRAEVLEIQRTFAKQPPALADGTPARGAILDGRDIGTVVCPLAPVKFFVTASPETRATRRFKELQSKGFPDTYSHVLADMRERDARDASRATAPMKPAPDALLLDTTSMTIDQVIAAALAHVKARLGGTL